MDGKLIAPERNDVEKNLGGHCEKQGAHQQPAYDQVCATTGSPPPRVVLCHRAVPCPLGLHKSYTPQRQMCTSLCGAWDLLKFVFFYEVATI